MRRIAIGFVILLLLGSCHSSDTGIPGDPRASSSGPFDRNGHLILTRHARCRMDCRHITDKEIHEILVSGTINYTKSEPDARPDPKYAVEGYTVERQHLRIVVAPEGKNLILITCIELGVEWTCDCN